jgi:CPA2 family monovalent cation:H+ antiporter-2
VQNVMPFRDYFASIFFISIGMLLETMFFAEHWLMLIALTTVLALTKTGMVLVTARALRYPVRSALLAGLALAQVGEFSFLLAQQGEAHGLIRGAVFQTFIDTSILTMLATPFIIQISPWFSSKMGWLEKASPEQPAVCNLTGHTVIAGYGLNGRNLARTLKATISPRVLEVNADTIRGAGRGESIIYGDITREDVLLRAGAIAQSDGFCHFRPCGNPHGRAIGPEDQSRGLHPGAHALRRGGG